MDICLYLLIGLKCIKINRNIKAHPTEILRAHSLTPYITQSEQKSVTI